MNSDRAAQIINELTPRPGYDHAAVALTDNYCSVRIAQLDAPESSPDRRGYRQFRGRPLPRWYRVRTAHCADAADVTYELASAYLNFDAHELREFLRDSDQVAHLHPHTARGRDAWERNGAMPGVTPERAPDARELIDAGALL